MKKIILSKIIFLFIISGFLYASNEQKLLIKAYKYSKENAYLKIEDKKNSSLFLNWSIVEKRLHEFTQTKLMYRELVNKVKKLDLTIEDRFWLDVSLREYENELNLFSNELIHTAEIIGPYNMIGNRTKRRNKNAGKLKKLCHHILGKTLQAPHIIVAMARGAVRTDVGAYERSLSKKRKLDELIIGILEERVEI